ncbi:MAG: YraN family protein [Ignavibacteria bacterium]
MFRRSTTNTNLGREGESIAREFLIKKGLKFVCSNFRFEGREIDLIFQDKRKRIIIFVEVKTRSDNSFGPPENAINKRKQANIKRAARDFLSQYKEFRAYDIRFDSVAIVSKETLHLINHIENAF